VRVLIDYRPALRQPTGVGEYAHQLATALVPRLAPDGKVVLFSSSWKDRLRQSAVPGAAIVDRRIPVSVLNLAWHRLEWPPAEWLAGPIDVAHSMHPLRIPARTAAQVVTIHDLFFLDSPERTSGEIRRDYPGLAATHAQAADAVIVVSEHSAREVMSRLNVPRERITVCSPGAPAWNQGSRFKVQGSGFRVHGPKPGPILFVGTIEPRKNVPTLIAAYRRLLSRVPAAPDLILAGRAHQEAAAVLGELAAPPLAGRARHLGYVTDHQREQLYRDASMVVLPSFEEGFGMPALEAMTIGVPVIASNRGALPEVVGDAGLLVDAEDIGGFANAMERLLQDQTLSSRCVEFGIERARRFSWTASAEALLQAYGRALQRRAGRAS
jgi:glycosyltransferase involved in cell wall biosynthesis